MAWTSRITTISMTMITPALIGYALDQWLGWLPWLTLLGAVFGMTAGMLQLLKIAASAPNQRKTPRNRDSS
ncbi:AtpZ/AtpI family protein [Lignipirellula cremea]|uniref:AtpZ/AtpI family protein n=1 Tax=Lignipirellula cremea TaxID=2528010 RepID=UPI0011A2DCFE|nr:AtpZ/AtpI family protein [Lignipirellula cremea]